MDENEIPAEEKVSAEEIKALINAESGWIELARLPSEEKYYKFGKEWLEQVRSTTKLVLLIEHVMAKAGAGHAKKCRPEVAAELERTVGKYLREDGTANPEYVASGNDVELSAWAHRAKKYWAKQMVKAESWGINLSNLPYKAGPEEIRNFVEGTLDKTGCVLAMDPWWAKKGWVHDGGATVYLSEKDAKDLLDAGAEELMFSAELRRRVRITPGSDGKLARLLFPQSSDPWD